MVWYFSTAAVFSYALVRGLLILRAKRGYRDFESSKSPTFILATTCSFFE